MTTHARRPRPFAAGSETTPPERDHVEPPRSMRAWVIQRTGGLDRLELVELPVPGAERSLGPREVRVAVRAAALNHLDLFVVHGLPLTYTFPHVIGSDAAGVVDGVGREVTSVRPGEPVMVNPGISCNACEFCESGEHSLCVSYQVLGEHLPGTMADYVVVPERNLAKIAQLDPALTWAEAAAFSLATLTAWRMVVTRAKVCAGEWVLVWGIGGSVALAAMRIAKLHGARVIVTSSSDAKLAEARKLGADVTLNHGTQKVGQEVRALTEKRGVDVVVESVGEATWEESLRALAKGGRLVTCGATTGPKVMTDVRRLFWNQYAILGATLGNEDEYREVVRWLGQGHLRPRVDRVYPLTQARAALERLKRGEQFGKIVVHVADEHAAAPPRAA
jgi:NADPH:quinone reductase-like Zn-dependent oxidoreductase